VLLICAFYDIHGGKREVLFLYFVPDTTRDVDKPITEKPVSSVKTFYYIHKIKGRSAITLFYPFHTDYWFLSQQTILESDTTFKVFLSFHSYGEVIIFPWGYTGDPCPDYVELLEGGTAMARV
jgi:hypothetical protein